MSADRIEKLLSANERFMDLNREALRAEVRKLQEENERLKKLVYYDSDAWTPVQFTETTGEMRKGWYTPGECKSSTTASIPHDIAPAQMVERIRVGPRSERSRADQCDWYKGALYKITTDNKGIPYCGCEGLEEWAEYVATDEDRIVYQYETKPTLLRGEWDCKPHRWAGVYPPLSELYRKNVSASDSLMRVWRDE